VTREKISRRELLTLAGAAGSGLALGAGGTRVLAAGTQSRTEPFHGEHQGGVATPQQERLHFAAFDLTTEDPAELRELMRGWTEAAARMCAGTPLGKESSTPYLPPDDTGEALGLDPGRLTITFGFGPTIFEKDGEDRFGLRNRRPDALVEIPPLPGDELDPKRCGGDLCVQACSDDAQVAFHAVRNLARVGRGVVVMRWAQPGFGRASSTSRAQQTPRNLMGFKDGTNNIRAEDEEEMRRYVWVGREGPGWMRGGTYLVARRIRMRIEVWDRSSLTEQEQTIGRHRKSGAPLGKEDEFDPVDPGLLPSDSHVRLAHQNEEQKILRRSYSFTDGMDPETGQLDAGLFFICFQRDPRRQFIPLQRRLGSRDRLMEYIEHDGSAIFACPPGARRGSFVGDGLLPS